MAIDSHPPLARWRRLCWHALTAVLVLAVFLAGGLRDHLRTAGIYGPAAVASSVPSSPPPTAPDMPVALVTPTTTTIPAATAPALPTQPAPPATTSTAPPPPQPAVPVEKPLPVVGGPDRYRSGCDGPVWAPAFAALGVTPLDLDVRGCEVAPSYSLASGEGGTACGLFAPGERIATVDRRTVDGGCHPRPLVVLVHELGHAWHTMNAGRDAWARSLGVESVANCFAAAALDIQLRRCPAALRAEVAAQMTLG